MKHIFKLLKKYSFLIIFVFVLLFMQAMFDLSLPEYTSKIVDIGIQQGGIESVVPNVITESEYNKLLLLVIDKEEVTKNYELITKDSKYLDSYPLLQEENLYLLKDISKSERKKLEDVITLPIIITYNLNSGNIDANQLFGGNIDSNLTVFQIIGSMTEEQRIDFISKLNATYSTQNVSLMNQTAIMYTKAEYQKIGINVEKIQVNYIIISGLKMLGLSLLSMAIAILTTFLSSKIAAEFGKSLRSKVVSKVMTYSNKEFESFSSASLITRSTNDIQQTQMLIVMLLRIVLFAPVLGLGALTKVTGSEMSWVIGLAILIILSLVIILFSITMPKFNKVQKLVDKVNLVAREMLTGVSVIRAFGNEKYEEKKFDEANTDLTKVNLFVNKVMTIMMPTMFFIMNATTVLIVWVGAGKIDSGTIQVGTLMAFITYTMQIIMSFLMLSMVSIMVPRALVSVKRIGEVLDKDSSIKQIDKPEKFDKNKKGVIEFKDVYFRYPDAEEDVLQNISFKALPGTTTAFIGSTGSGKSTLINLIMRFFDVTGGKILVDGVNIKNADIKQLRSKIGYVPQKGILFTGDIASNISFGKNVNSQELEKAARISQSLEFIKNTGEEYKTKISQGGTNVSGGQRQRLSIARAIAINPDIYIFDDSFSALDYKTDVKLRTALSKEIKNATILIVAQRISTVINADQIIVLDKGQIVGIGKHSELLKDCEVYKEISLSQLSKEELENE